MDDKTKTSLQDLGANLLVGQLLINNPAANVTGYGKECAAVKTSIGGRPAVVFTRTCMFPKNYEKNLAAFMPQLKEEIKKIRGGGSFKDCDIYAAGIGAVQKYVSSDKEKGSFRIGGKYAAAFGRLHLLEKAEGCDYGYTAENPVNLDEIATEYHMVKNLKAVTGTVMHVDRNGSLSGKDGHHVDLWTVDVEEGNNSLLRYRYKIFLDPYAISRDEYFAKWSKIPFSEWDMPDGFYVEY